MKHYILLAIAALQMSCIFAGGELQQGVPWQELEKKEIVKEEMGYGDWSTRIFKDGGKLYNQLDIEGYSSGYIYEDPFGNTTYYNPSKQITKYEKTKRTPQTALSLQEQIAKRLGKQAVEAALKRDAGDCADLETFIDSSVGTLTPVIEKELEKYMSLCNLLTALNGITQRVPQQFERAEKIINTQVGRGEHYLLDPDTIVANQSLLSIILSKAVRTENSMSFQELLHLAQMLMNKKPTVGSDERQLLNVAPKVETAAGKVLGSYLKR